MGVRPVKFRTIVENLENSIARGMSHLRSPEWALSKRFYADFQVVVDGELRASRIDFTRADGEIEIQVDLFQKDRFLTLASTDGGGKIAVDGFDRVVLVDPTLELAESETTKQGEKTVSPLVKTRWN